MELTFHLYNLIFLSSVLSASSTGCSLYDVIDACSFTVECEGSLSKVKPPQNCRNKPNVTFIIRNSVSHYLTKDFFFYTTKFNRQVTNIRAINNIWTYISRYTFYTYTKCSTMDLSNNNIKNIENDAFRNMFFLNFLNLSSNAIELLNKYSFRCDNMRCKLTNLDLSYNLLTHISKEPLRPLTYLNYLAIHHNRIQTLSSDSFSNLQRLRILDLKYNQLTTLNDALANVQSLYRLDVSSNNLIGLSEYEFNQTTHLKYVNLSNNAIEVIETDCFAHALDLTELDLRNNKIRSSIDDTMFMHNSQLHELNLSNNSIKCVHDNAFKHNAEHIKVSLELNPLRENIFKELFCDPNSQTMTRMQFNNQNITAIKSDSFPELTNLVYLNLSKNFIGVIDNNAFPNFVSLNVLDISFNSLSKLNFFKNSLVNLTELYLNNNKITIIIKDTFVNQINLVKLDLSMNSIFIIDQFSLPLRKLEYLNINGNMLQSILKKNVVCPSKHLRFVDLSKTALINIDNETFIDCPSLVTVDLSDNLIRDIGANNFIRMGSLYSLDLSNNMLTTLKLTHTFLKHLNLSGNFFSNGSLEGLSLNLVESIDLSRNLLQILDEQSLYKCNLLENLIINNNNITDIDVKKLLKTLPHLESLSLMGNPIACAEIIDDHEVVSISVDKVFEKDILHKLRLQCANAIKIETTMPEVDDVTTTSTVTALSSSYTIDSVTEAENYNVTDVEHYDFTDADNYNVTDAENYKVTDTDNYNVTDAVNYKVTEAENYVTDAENYKVTDTGIGNTVTVRHVMQPQNGSSLLIHVSIGCAVLTTLFAIVGAGWYFYKRKRVYVLNESKGMSLADLNR